jgi:hypothetical protein
VGDSAPEATLSVYPQWLLLCIRGVLLDSRCHNG